MLQGPLTRFGLVVARSPARSDQASKLWLLFVFDLANRGIVHLTPFLDLVLTWNTGISYGLFPQESDFGRYVLLALKAAAVLVLWVWLARAELAAHRAGARPHHRGRDRQCHRPARLRGGCRLRAVPHHDTGVQFHLVRV